MCELAFRLPLLPLLRRALPLELDRQGAGTSVVQSLYLRDLIASPFQALEDLLVSLAAGLSGQDHKIFAIAQTSGAGQTKVTYDVGMNSRRSRGIVAISLRVLHGQTNLRGTWRVFGSLVRYVFGQARLHAEGDKRRRHLVLTAFAADQRWSGLASHLGEAMIRAQRHSEFDRLVLAEFSRQTKHAGLDQASLNTTLAQLKVPFAQGLFFSYDEVTAPCKECGQRINTGVAPPNSRYRRATSPFSVLSCAMETLLQQNYRR